MRPPLHFRVRTSLKRGARGTVVIVRVYEILGTGFSIPSNTFLIDLECVPALTNALKEAVQLQAYLEGYDD